MISTDNHKEATVPRQCDDAFGRMLLDHLEGRPSFEVIERRDGKVTLTGGPAEYFKRFDDWPPHQRDALGCASGRVLDVGCGAGRHSLHLQDAGFDVVGVDNSPRAIEVCRRRGLRRAELLPLHLLTLALGQFDTILMLGSNFGLFGRPRWLAGRLQRLGRLLSPTGRIIVDSYDPFRNAEPEDHAYFAANLALGRPPGQLCIRVRYGSFKTPWFDYLVVSADEMDSLIMGTGWAVEWIIDHGDGRYAAVLERNHGER